MGRARPLALSCSLLLGLVPPTAAQGPPAESSLPPSTPAFVALSPAQDRELEKWLSAMDKWQRYDAKWYNRPVHDGWGRPDARRQQPPDPPVWLEAYCTAAAVVVEVDERTMKACRLLADPRAGNASLPTPGKASRTDAEKPPKHSSFWTRVHLDGLWTTSPTGGRFYGIIGSHVSLVDVGRLQVFGPPGVLLLSVPDGENSRRITLGYTWGVSLRLTDVRLFGPTKNMTLFLNVSKVWLDFGDERSKFRGFDIAGFSLAPRRKR